MFITVILLIAFGMNFYVLARLCGLFAIKKRLLFWAAVLLLSVSLIAATAYQSHYGNIFSRISYTIAAGWYGVLWLLFSALLVYEILRLFIKIKPHVAGIGILTIVELLVIYAIINAQLIRITSITIPGPCDVDIVQLSDIHLGSVSAGYLQRVIDETNALMPDMILITGDLVDNHNKTTQKAIGMLSGLSAPVLFVNGNHEYYAGKAKVNESIEKAGVKILSNEWAQYCSFIVAGIEYSDNQDDLEGFIKSLKTDESQYCILMSHGPVNPETVVKYGIDLTLTGHTHGGQIFPFNLVVKWAHPHLTGLHKYNGSYIYGTSGTGTWGPRMRLGTRSEIVLVKIREKVQ
jgi:uncharacterized protein